MGRPAPAQHKHRDLPLTGSQERNLQSCHHKAGAHGHRCNGHPLQIQRRARVRQKQTEKPHLKVSTCPAAQHKGPQCNSGQEVAPGSSNALVGVGYQLSMRRNALPTTQGPQIITISLSTCCGLGLGRAPLLDVVRARLTPQLGVWPGWRHPGRLCSQELSAGAPSSPQQDGPNCFTRQVRGLNRGCQAPKLWARSHAASLLLCSVQSKYKDARGQPPCLMGGLTKSHAQGRWGLRE